MAQDEWGHARLLYAMLKDLDLDPAAVERDRPASGYANLDVLDAPLADWAEVVAFMVAVDGALTSAMEAFAAGSYEPAGARIPKMLAEEVFHRELGVAWFRRLAVASEEASRRLAESLRAALPRTLAWLDPADAPHRALVAGGLVAPGAVGRYLDHVGAVFEGVGVAPAEVRPERGGWDVERGRGPGEPEAGAVERARGDRNRALLVE